MVRKLVLSLACLSALPAAADAAGAATRQKAAAAHTQPSARPGHGQAKTRQAIVVRHRTTRSGERIYSVNPDTEAAQTNKIVREPVYAASEDPFVAFAPTGTSVVGVGLVRMPKVDRLDPNRTNPLRVTKGKTTKAAAVGMKVAF